MSNDPLGDEGSISYPCGYREEPAGIQASPGGLAFSHFSAYGECPALSATPTGVSLFEQLSPDDVVTGSLVIRNPSGQTVAALRPVVPLSWFLEQSSDPEINWEDTPVHIMRIVIRMSADDHAGTDDPVGIKFGSGSFLYLDSGGWLYLDSHKNDFEAGSVNEFHFVYALSPFRGLKVSDIADSRLYIGRSGEDGCKLHSVKLYVNGASDPLVNHIWDDGIWVPDNGWVLISGSSMRQQSWWSRFHTGQQPKVNTSVPTYTGEIVIPANVVASLLETLVGHLFADRGYLRWGTGGGLTVSRKSDDAIEAVVKCHFLGTVEYEALWGLMEGEEEFDALVAATVVFPLEGDSYCEDVDIEDIDASLLAKVAFFIRNVFTLGAEGREMLNYLQRTVDAILDVIPGLSSDGQATVISGGGIRCTFT